MKLKFNSTARIQLAGAAMLLLYVLFSDFGSYRRFYDYYENHQYALGTSGSYYIFVRIAMTVIGAYLAYDYYRRERKELAVTFAVIAAVSPSQLKIEFDSDFMTIVDALVTVLLLILAMKEAGFSLKEWKNKHDIQINFKPFKTMTEKQSDNREERGTSSILQDAADNNSSAQYGGNAYAEKVEPSKGQPPFFSSLFSFKGRNTRSRFWLVWGLFCLGLLLALTFDKGSGRYGVFVNRFLDIVLVILGICSYWIELANNVKRLHDLGHSGWNVLWLLVPIICFVYCIYTAFWKGEMHDNKYGPNPYE